MASTYFTPIVIIVLICIALGGLVITNFIDSIFIDNDYRKVIQLFCIGIILNIMIFTFLVMSFSKIKFAVGNRGPRGIKGSIGYTGQDGRLENCGKTQVSVFDKRTLDRLHNYLDLTPPTIIN